MTIGLLGTLEWALLLVGLKPAYIDQDPLVGFSSHLPHFVLAPAGDQQTTVSVAPGHQTAFNAQQFGLPKPPGTYRVFCVGDSTVYGRPFFDATSVAGWLRALLPAVDPTRPWEVVNAGAISYASYRVTRVMEQLCQYEPDLFVVYVGHNEFLERRTYEGLFATPWLLREATGLVWRMRIATAVRKTLDQLSMTAPSSDQKPIVFANEVTAVPVNSVGPNAYTRNDRLKGQVVQHFRLNLLRMVGLAQAAGAQIVLVTPASNLAHFAPFKSQHRDGLSAAALRTWDEHYRLAKQHVQEGYLQAGLAAFQRAAAIDDRYAALHFHLGQTLLQLGDQQAARRHLEQAREEDICPLRAIGAITNTVREVAAEMRIPLVDFDRFVTEHAPQHIPDETLFHDHVHLRIDANRSLALEIMTVLMDAGIVHRGPTWGPQAIDTVTSAVERRIDRTAHAGELHKLARMLEWLGQHQQARKTALEALQLSDGSADSLYQVGLLCHQQKDPSAAAQYYQQAIDQKPDCTAAHLQLGLALAALGRADEAIDHLTRAIELQPDAAAAHTQLGLLLTQQGRLAQAKDHFAEAARIEPESDAAHNNLGLALVHLGRPEEAIASFRRAVDLNPENSSARLNYGIALQAQGKWTEAMTCYRAVLRVKPNHPTARARLLELERRVATP
ncbi:MAG: hypothetical protein A2W31_09430 [Planctomycetes bacterium RBG_16_64_10]|nr:MAG: hypothetical protein A2W31_09430 [Planctomycetes bacterium RBG_16_64_10]